MQRMGHDNARVPNWVASGVSWIRNGQMVIPFEYDDAGDFNGGPAYATPLGSFSQRLVKIPIHLTRAKQDSLPDSDDRIANLKKNSSLPLRRRPIVFWHSTCGPSLLRHGLSSVIAGVH